ncbi:MAG: T9SS C-terminal target domain-containing protein [Chitinophagaceae bacterium]|nr:MAG: T9SS C-terminal target domain-containing protein [Chitinophagaceae bacterium]
MKNITCTFLLFIIFPLFIYSQCGSLTDRDMQFRKCCHPSGCQTNICKLRLVVPNWLPWVGGSEIVSANGSCAPPIPKRTRYSAPVYRTIRFKAEWQSNTDYNFNLIDLQDLASVCNNNNITNTDAWSLQNSWNKLGRWAARCNYRRDYVTAGWKWNASQNKIELGLYTHIDHRNQSGCNDGHIGIEWINMKQFVEQNEEIDIEYVFSHRGLYMTAGDKTAVIRRQILPMYFGIPFPEVSGYIKRGYFGGNSPAPHNMNVETENYVSDCIPVHYLVSADKYFGRSEFYDGEDVAICATNEVVLSHLVAGQGNVDGFPIDELFTIMHSGTRVQVVAGNRVDLLTGFHAEAGSFVDIRAGGFCLSSEPLMLGSGDDEGPTEEQIFAIFGVDTNEIVSIDTTIFAIRTMLAYDTLTPCFQSAPSLEYVPTLFLKDDSFNIVDSTSTIVEGSYWLDLDEPLRSDSINLYTLALDSGSGLKIKDPGFHTIPDWVNDTLLVLWLEKVEASFDVDTPTCKGQTVHFTNTTTGGVPPYTYLWYFGDGLRSTTENPLHTYQTTDTFSVMFIVTDSIGCKDTIISEVIIEDCPTIMSKFYEKETDEKTSKFMHETNNDNDDFYFYIYPNPVKEDILNLKFNLPEDTDMTVKITNVSGQILNQIINSSSLEKGLHGFVTSIAHLSNGVYFIHVRTKNETSTKRLIILKEN